MCCQAEERARRADAAVSDLRLQLAAARESAEGTTPHSTAALAAQAARLGEALQEACARAAAAQRSARCVISLCQNLS